MPTVDEDVESSDLSYLANENSVKQYSLFGKQFGSFLKN